MLQRSLFDTASLSQPDRLKTWRELATAVWEISDAEPDGFYANVDLWHGGDLLFGSIASSSQATRRDLGRILDDGLDYYALQFYMGGRRQVRSGGREAVVCDGGLLSIDMTQPLETASTRYRSLDLGVPRRLLTPLLRDPEAHGGRTYPAQDALVALLRRHVLALYRAAPQMTREDCASQQEGTVALIAAVLNGRIDDDVTEGLRRATLFALRHQIETHLADARLSPEGLAQSFGISRATLYRVMTPVGGFQTYVSRRRLHRCRDEIASNAGARISDIAGKWGFLNAASFSSQFRRAFGMSPREWRSFAQAVYGGKTLPGDAANWSRWLSALSVRQG